MRRSRLRGSAGATRRSTVVACAAVLAGSAVLVALAGVLFGHGQGAAERPEGRARAGATTATQRPLAGPHDTPARTTAGCGRTAAQQRDQAAAPAQAAPRTPAPAAPVDRARALFRVLDPKGYARAEQPGPPPTSGDSADSTPASAPTDVPALLAQIQRLPMDDPGAVRFAQQLMLECTIPAVRLAALRRLQAVPGGLSVDVLEKLVKSAPLSGAEGIAGIAAYQALLKSGEPTAAASARALAAAEPDAARRAILVRLSSAGRR